MRSIEDPALVAEMAARGIVLEVCPVSNLCTGVYRSHAEHPLNRLAAAGVRITLNSDDPPYFDTSIGTEYAAARDHYGWDDGRLRRATRTALEAAFVDEETRSRLLGLIAD